MDEIHTPLLVDVDPSRNLNDLLAERVRSSPDGSLVERRSADGSKPTSALRRRYSLSVVRRYFATTAFCSGVVAAVSSSRS